MEGLRPAVEGDQKEIRKMVRAARLNPLGLDWRRFLVVERDGQLLGIGQVKPRGDGSRELASLAVRPAHQGQGIGGTLIRALIAREEGPLYLMCRPPLEGYYVRFGFVRADPDQLLPVLRRLHHIGRVIQFVTRYLPVSDLHPVIMIRATAEGNGG